MPFPNRFLFLQGGGRPKVRRKRSVQWAPPAGTAGSEDLIESEVVLREDQALGQVVTSQANFMRVLVEKSGVTAGSEAATAGGEKVTAGDEVATAGDASAPAGSPRNGSELLCVVRALLKKIRKRVLVGDKVLVSAIDWVEGRGMIEEIVERKSQMEDPPIANVDHFLVLFALARPPLEPIQLSRFLVAAEHAGIPFTLALNKVRKRSASTIRPLMPLVLFLRYSRVQFSVAHNKAKSVGCDDRFACPVLGRVPGFRTLSHCTR